MYFSKSIPVYQQLNYFSCPILSGFNTAFKDKSLSKQVFSSPIDLQTGTLKLNISILLKLF